MSVLCNIQRIHTKILPAEIRQGGFIIITIFKCMRNICYTQLYVRPASTNTVRRLIPAIHIPWSSRRRLYILPYKKSDPYTIRRLPNVCFRSPHTKPHPSSSKRIWHSVSLFLSKVMVIFLPPE